jgi:hypothetical protein
MFSSRNYLHFQGPIECTAIPDFDVPEKDATKIDP